MRLKTGMVEIDWMYRVQAHQRCVVAHCSNNASYMRKDGTYYKIYCKTHAEDFKNVGDG